MDIRNRYFRGIKILFRKEKIVLFILLFFVLTITGCYIKDCGKNITDFRINALECKRASVKAIYEDNIIRFTSRGEWFGNCKYSIKIEEIGEKIRDEKPMLARMAEGKTLNCNIPSEIIKFNNSNIITNLTNLNLKYGQYCSGPIKDALECTSEAYMIKYNIS